jgi:diaminopimelate epimerase
MKKINFTKMVASGNDFVVVDSRRKSHVAGLSSFARKICDRKFGIGADGLLILDKSKAADVRMRIFNADGSEAEMCGNGARCTAKFAGAKVRSLKTQAGIIKTKIMGDKVSIKLTDPQGIRLDIPVMVNGRLIKVNFINTGVPHAVIFTAGLEKIQVPVIGRFIRYHKQFAPKGTNVNFVVVLNKNAIKIRTYERGVEDETLACGTGSVASALIFALKSKAKDKVMVHTKGGEALKVYFKREGLDFSEVWLEGKAQIAYKGVYYV